MRGNLSHDSYSINSASFFALYLQGQQVKKIASAGAEDTTRISETSAAPQNVSEKKTPIALVHPFLCSICFRELLCLNSHLQGTSKFILHRDTKHLNTLSHEATQARFAYNFLRLYPHLFQNPGNCVLKNLSQSFETKMIHGRLHATAFLILFSLLAVNLLKNSKTQESVNETSKSFTGDEYGM